MTDQQQLRCTVCGALDAYDGEPGRGLCDFCFVLAVQSLTRRVLAASDETIEHEYRDGMKRLGVNVATS